MEKALKELLSDIRGIIKDDDKVVVKSLPMKKEWVKEFNRARNEIDKLQKARDQIESDSKRFWATVQLDLNDFTSDKRVNMKTNEIEIMGDKNPKTSIKSPLSEM